MYHFTFYISTAQIADFDISTFDIDLNRKIIILRYLGQEPFYLVWKKTVEKWSSTETLLVWVNTATRVWKMLQLN